MNKTKVLILLIIVISVIIFAVVLIQKSTPRNVVVNLCVFNNDYLANQSQPIIKSLSTVIDTITPNEIRVILTAIDRTGARDTIFKRKPGESKNIWLTQFNNGMRNLLLDTPRVVLPNDKTNELFLQFLDEIKVKGKDKQNIYVFTGTFPECYDLAAARDLVETIKTSYKKDDLTGKLIWLIIDPRTAEKYVLDSLLKYSSLEVADMKLLFKNPRECHFSDLSLVFGIFFDKLEPQSGGEFIDIIKKKISNKFTLTIWNDSPKNNTKLNYFGYSDDSLNLIKNFESLHLCQWSSIQFLLKQALNTLQTFPDTVTKNLILVGKLPTYTGARILEKGFWKKLVSIKNLNIYLHYPSNLKLDIFDKEFQSNLKRNNINFIIL